MLLNALQPIVSEAAWHCLVGADCSPRLFTAPDEFGDGYETRTGAASV